MRAADLSPFPLFFFFSSPKSMGIVNTVACLVPFPVCGPAGRIKGQKNASPFSLFFPFSPASSDIRSDTCS